jgi:hypothetical protein
MRLAGLFAFAMATIASAQDKTGLELNGRLDGRGLPMAECDSDVYRIQLQIQWSKPGEGTGTLVLDTTPNPVDDFGRPITIKAIPPLKLECTVKLVKKKKVLAESPPGVPAAEVEVHLYEVTGPRIVSHISIAHESSANWATSRLLWASKDGKNRTPLLLLGPQPELRPPPPPCHPGCFPSGTRIETPGGNKAVEDLRAGDVVTTVGTGGKPGKGKVAAMFVTRNILVEVNIEGKTLICTGSQPLALADGKLKGAGELKAGEEIQVWVKGAKGTAKVKSVVITGRESLVYNAVLGDPVLFVADGFVARSKPPAPPTVAP